MRSLNYNIGNEDDDTKYEKDYKDEDFSEGDDDDIPLDDEGFEFLNANKDECIGSLRGDVFFFFCLTLDGETDSKNKWKLSSDEDDVDLKVMKLLVVMIKMTRMKEKEKEGC